MGMKRFLYVILAGVMLFGCAVEYETRDGTRHRASFGEYVVVNDNSQTRTTK